MKFMKRLSMRVITGVLVSCILIWLNPRGLRTFADNTDPNTLGFDSYFNGVTGVERNMTATYKETVMPGNGGIACTRYKPTNPDVCDTWTYYFTPNNDSIGSIVLPNTSTINFKSGWALANTFIYRRSVTIPANGNLSLIFLVRGNGGSYVSNNNSYYHESSTRPVGRTYYASNGNRIGDMSVGAVKFTNKNNYSSTITIDFNVTVGALIIPLYWGSEENMPLNARSFANLVSVEQETNEKLGDINNSIKDTNDTLKNDNVDGASGSAGGFFEGFDSDFGGLTGIITAPLVFINSLASSCNDLDLPLGIVPGNLKLPCAKTIYVQYFGPLYNIYVTLTDGLVAYFVVKGLFRLFEDMKDPDKSRVDVIDL